VSLLLVHSWKASRCYTDECSERELGGVLLWPLLVLDVHQCNRSWQLLHCLLLDLSTVGILFTMLQ